MNTLFKIYCFGAISIPVSMGLCEAWRTYKKNSHQSDDIIIKETLSAGFNRGKEGVVPGFIWPYHAVKWIDTNYPK
jgi:hypothetical protein